MPHADFDSGVLKAKLGQRLRSAEGHLRGIAGMVERGADCESVMRRVLAVQASLREINRLMLRHHLGQ